MARWLPEITITRILKKGKATCGAWVATMVCLTWRLSLHSMWQSTSSIPISIFDSSRWGFSQSRSLLSDSVKLSDIPSAWYVKGATFQGSFTDLHCQLSVCRICKSVNNYVSRKASLSSDCQELVFHAGDIHLGNILFAGTSRSDPVIKQHRISVMRLDKMIVMVVVVQAIKLPKPPAALQKHTDMKEFKKTQSYQIDKWWDLLAHASVLLRSLAAEVCLILWSCSRYSMGPDCCQCPLLWRSSWSLALGIQLDAMASFPQIVYGLSPIEINVCWTKQLISLTSL